MAKEIEFIVQVRRGNMHANLPFSKWSLQTTNGVDLAWLAVEAMVNMQNQFIGRASKPIDPASHTPLVVRPLGRDKALNPIASLWVQFEGLWKDFDETELGTEGLIEGISEQCSYTIVELVESLAVPI